MPQHLRLSDAPAAVSVLLCPWDEPRETVGMMSKFTLMWTRVNKFIPQERETRRSDVQLQCYQYGDVESVILYRWAEQDPLLQLISGEPGNRLLVRINIINDFKMSTLSEPKCSMIAWHCSGSQEEPTPSSFHINSIFGRDWTKMRFKCLQSFKWNIPVEDQIGWFHPWDQVDSIWHWDQQ